MVNKLMIVLLGLMLVTGLVLMNKEQPHDTTDLTVYEPANTGLYLKKKMGLQPTDLVVLTKEDNAGGEDGDSSTNN